MKSNVFDGPVGIILDTDMGNDVDDALALGMLHALESRGECTLLAVVVNKGNIWAPRFVDLVNTFYNRGDIPIGWVGETGPTTDEGRFTKAVCETNDDGIPRYRRTYMQDEFQPPMELLRKTLVVQPDMSVVVASIGFLTNLAALIQSGSCVHSSLSGIELIRRKVRFLSVMAGDFSPEALKCSNKQFAEYNVVKDIPSAAAVLSHWPGGIVFTGYELGNQVPYPAESIVSDFQWTPHHPVVDAYKLFLDMPYDRPCWDPLCALYAVQPDTEAFSISPQGTVGLFEDGNTSFTPNTSGNHFYLKADERQTKQLKRVLIDLCSQPPFCA